MLTIWRGKQRLCDGMTRRSFFKLGAFGASLSLAEWLRLRATAGPAPPSHKSAIMIYLLGGPSHTDIYDLKPNAPAEFRGEFKPMATNVPGLHICEHLPLQAKMFDKLALLRAVVPQIEEHSDSLVMSGYGALENRTADHPSFGAVVSKLRGGHGTVPPYVSLPYSGPIIFPRGNEPGYLGVAHRPFMPNGPVLKDLSLAPNQVGPRLNERKQLLEAFDKVRRDIDASGSMAGLDAFQTRAFDMILNGRIRQALDLNQEAAPVRERYKGLESFLTARRLVEAGVGCVTFSFGSWDTHGNLLPNFPTLRRQLPLLDRGLANLIQDLHERGLAKDVVTVVWGEFGRTPKLNPGASRDHWPAVMSALVAGGGLKMGQVIGATTSRGEQPRDGRYTVPQVLSTLYGVLGIDPAQTFPNRTGRPMAILDDRDPVTELL